MDGKEQEDLREIEERAKELFKQRELTQVLALYEEAESKGLDSSKLSAAHAIALARLGKLPKARELIHEKLKQYPEEPGLYEAKAIVSGKRRKWQETLAICDYAASIGLWSKELAEIKSECLLRLATGNEAISGIQQDLRKYPESAILHLNLARVYRKLGDTQQFKLEWTTGLSLDPALAQRIRKKQCKLWWIIVVFAGYLIIGMALLPASRYFMIPFGLFCVGLGASVFLFHIKARKRRLAGVYLILIGAFLTVYLSFYSGKFLAIKDPLALLGGLALFVVVALFYWAFKQRHSSQHNSVRQG